MTDQSSHLHKQHLLDHWQVWAALHHFLPARSLRDLLEVIVGEISLGTLRFEQLFDDIMSGEPNVMSAWLVRPLESPSALATYLHNRVRGFVWQSDTPCHFEMDKNEPPGNTRPAILEAAIELGALDFGALERASQQVQKHAQSANAQPSLVQFVAALKAAAAWVASPTDEVFTADFLPTLDSLQSPLDALVSKHVGDLCADVDSWEKAYRCYQQAEHRLASPIDHWPDFKSWFAPLVAQSQAAALRHMQGPGPAAASLSKLLADASTVNASLIIANAGLDARALHYQSSDTLRWSPDNRAVLLLPPLLHGAQDIARPLRSWLNGKTDSTQFWAVLRRQIALGSTIESQTTKAFYARSIVDRLDSDKVHHITRESFELAVRLIIESGDDRCAAEIRWHESLVHTYVDEPCVTSAVQHANHYAASSEQRQFVLLRLFESWILLLAPERASVAHAMLKVIAATALDGHASLNQAHNLGGEGLESLSRIAGKRPEWRESVAADVAAAIIAKLSRLLYWSAKTVALEAALAYADAFSDGRLRDVVNCTLAMTDQIKPAAQNWTVVRPAFNLLVSPPVKRLAGLAPELGQQIIATILRFGIHDATEQTRVMFYLHDFDAALLRDKTVAAALHDTVTELRRLSSQINSSNVTEHILALILSPVISGREGVKDAIVALGAVFKSAIERRPPSMGLPSAYQPLILLADKQSQIAQDLELETRDFQAWLEPLLVLVIEIWARAKDVPEIFSTFSLPPNPRPNPVIVHNWAFASLAFAESLRNKDAMRQALNVAATQPSLANAITLGRATRSITDVGNDFDLNAILEEKSATFYEALGRRVALLRLLDQERAHALCAALVTQCFSHGPKALDAAVLYAAARLELGDHVRKCTHSHYTKKLDNDRDTKLAVEPILATFNVQGLD